MNIFFIGSIRGGRGFQPHYKHIASLLKHHGAVLSEHVAEEDLPRHGETELTEREIHDRELDRLVQADMVVAEVSTPSLGVGHLISRALDEGKRVVCLCQEENRYQLSAMIKGNTRIELFFYTDEVDLSRIIEKLFGQEKKEK